jgi:metal-responsive CopG/Arc/MetJ family transcriptional regulator
MKSRTTPPSSRVRRVTVSLPAELFERGENERRRRQERRSEFVAGLYRRYLDEVEERDRVARYEAAYARLPETREERWLVERSREVLEQEFEE